ncbi:MAG: ATP synthase subunit I [Mariprofundaceae bacterium]|nr:ATP synthase subunit I [Mariprofundaceae bacterium]
MTVLTPDLDHKKIIERLVFLQLTVALIAVPIVTIVFSLMFAVALCYGIIVVLASGLMMHRNIHKATDADPDQGKKMLLKSAAIRFIMVLALLFFAYAIGLHLLWVAAGFFVGQLLAYIYFTFVFYHQQKQSMKF